MTWLMFRLCSFDLSSKRTLTDRSWAGTWAATAPTSSLRGRWSWTSCVGPLVWTSTVSATRALGSARIRGSTVMVRACVRAFVRLVGRLAIRKAKVIGWSGNGIVASMAPRRFAYALFSNRARVRSWCVRACVRVCRVCRVVVRCLRSSWLLRQRRAPALRSRVSAWLRKGFVCGCISLCASAVQHSSLRPTPQDNAVVSLRGC